jgi:DNA replication protein DnaC
MRAYVPVARRIGALRRPAGLDIARRFATDPVGWLVVSGPSGSGKTRLAAAVANERIASGASALFTDVLDLLDSLRAGFAPGEDEPSYAQLFEAVRNAPFLILDGIDSSAGTPWAREKLFHLVNHRYTSRLPTLFTTTTAPGALEDRLATRLADATIAQQVVLPGPQRERYRNVGGMSRERLADFQFRTFDLSKSGLNEEEHQSLEHAFRAASIFGEEPKGFITFQGVNGSGKTHLAAAIANKALLSGLDVFFAVVPDLLDELRAGFAPGKDGESYAEIFGVVRNAGLLVLDDLGAQRSAQWAEEKLYQIVNYRSVAGLPTVVTTDRDINQLDATYPRIVARIADPRVGGFFAILAPHYRYGRTVRTKSTVRRSHRDNPLA